MYLLNTTLPGDFFTPSSFGTLAGATFIVFAVCSGIQNAFNYNPKWLALLVSLVVSFLAAFITDSAASGTSGGVKYVIAFLNGFLIYASASGTNQVVGKDPPGKTRGGASPAAGRPAPAHTERRRFLTRWR